MVFNPNFNNISVILWRSILLMEYPEKTTDLLQVTDKLYHMYDYILLINNYIYYFVVGSERGSPSEPDGNVDVATLAEAMLDQSPSNSVHSNQDQESHDGAQQNLSSLELENKLLKNEVQSLNQEMSSVVNRAKEAETGKLVFTCTLKPQFYW